MRLSKIRPRVSQRHADTQNWNRRAERNAKPAELPV
jgi:hypothetical protein